MLIEQIDIWTDADTEKKAGRGRNAGNAASVYGVKKLRELILELAVRGKLVPQDPNDEPASELLKRIQAEKAKLIAEGKIKKDKPLPPIMDEDKPFELPLNWAWVRFGEIAQHNSGKTLDNGRNKGTLRRYITTSNLYWGRFDLGDIRLMPISDDELEKCSVRDGDLLICEGGEAGRAAVWHNGDGICFQNHIHRARFYMGIDPLLIHRLFEKMNASGEIDQHRKGVGISNMSGKSLSLIIVPLPPLAEQQRIVAKVDELMALCDQLETQHNNVAAAHGKLVSSLLDTLTLSQSAAEFGASWQRIATHFDTLFTTEASIDALKQTLLQLAVMGKLVPQDPNDEPASELLKRIGAEKARLIAEGKIKKSKALPPMAEEEKSFELPPRWEWARLQSVIDVRDGTHDSPKEADVAIDSYPLVTSKDFCGGKINFDTARRISEADHLEISKRSLVEKHDILFSMIGGNIGNQVLVEVDRPFSIKNVALFKYYDRNLTFPLFIKKYAENLAVNFQAYAVGGAQPFVALGSLRTLVIALPPFAEQHRIVAKVDELMAVCEDLKTRITAANLSQRKLADVMVEQAIS